MTDARCPFCGSKVTEVRRPFVDGGSVTFFKCVNNATCGAVMSFDSDAAFVAQGDDRHAVEVAAFGRRAHER